MHTRRCGGRASSGSVKRVECACMEKPGSPAWKSLLARAVMSLDEDELAAFEKEKAAKEKRYAQSVKDGEKPPYDFYMVQEVLVEYDKTGYFDLAVRFCNGNESECVAAKKLDAEIGLVWKFVEGNVAERMKAQAMDIAQTAQTGLKAVVTDEKCKLNVKALELALAGTMPGLYGKQGRGGRSDGDDGVKRIPAGGGGIMINIIGDAAMKLMKPAVEGRSGGVYIDV